MSDIVDELRNVANRPDANYPATMLDAADEIERLRAALEEVKALVFGANHSETRYPLARAALEGPQDRIGTGGDE